MYQSHGWYELVGSQQKHLLAKFQSTCSPSKELFFCHFGKESFDLKIYRTGVIICPPEGFTQIPWMRLSFLKAVHFSIWVFPKIGVPQNGWFIMENPSKMDDLGGTTIFGNIHIIQGVLPRERSPEMTFFSTSRSTKSMFMKQAKFRIHK